MKAQFDTNEQYHSAPGISASGLKSIHKKSVYHFINQKPFESSAMALGTAVHCAMLEPESYYNEFHVMPLIFCFPPFFVQWRIVLFRLLFGGQFSA